MAISTTDLVTAKAQNIEVTDDTLTLDLTDGRSISAPLAWYPRLLHGNSEELSHWEFIGDGEGIHWPELDEDLSVEGIVLGRRSGESQRSFQRWLDERAKNQMNS